MKKMLISAALILLLFSLAACSQEPDDTKEEGRVVAVEVAEATKGDLVIERSVLGRAVANRMAPVMIQMAGEVDSLEVHNGDQVEEDDIIAVVTTPAGKQNVRAPKDGEIANLTAAEGDVISNEEPFAIVADLETMKLDFSVTAKVRELFLIEEKLPVIINNHEYEAVITGISKIPNDTGLYLIQANVKNETGAILPGLVAELFVPEQQIKGAILVPTAAVVEENDETFVYTVQEDKTVKQLITILKTQSEQTAIEGGVEVGDQLVVTGQLTLSDGRQVNVVKGE